LVWVATATAGVACRGGGGDCSSGGKPEQPLLLYPLIPPLAPNAAAVIPCRRPLLLLPPLIVVVVVAAGGAAAYCKRGSSLWLSSPLPLPLLPLLPTELALLPLEMNPGGGTAATTPVDAPVSCWW
jgi:hypothetical protein